MEETETWVIRIAAHEDARQLERWKRILDTSPGIIPFSELFSDGYEYTLEFTTKFEDGMDADWWANNYHDEMSFEFDITGFEFVTSR